MLHKFLFVVLGFLVLAAPVVSGCAAVPPPSPGSAQPLADNSHLMFVQSISHGNYRDSVLSLTETLPMVVDYTDFEHRLVAYMTADLFVDLWNKDIKDYEANPPRALLETTDNASVLMEMYAPDIKTGALTFRVKILSGNMPAKFDAASLIIKAVPAPPKQRLMAFPGSVSSNITDSVTQANVKVLGDAPAIAMGNLYQATAQALSNAAHNATTQQQQSSITAQAATNMGVSTLYSMDTAESGKATNKIFQ